MPFFLKLLLKVNNHADFHLSPIVVLSKRVQKGT